MAFQLASKDFCGECEFYHLFLVFEAFLLCPYAKWCEPKLVINALELLDNEIPKLKDKIKSVQLCFTTDPFMYGYEEIQKMSLNSFDNCILSCPRT